MPICTQEQLYSPQGVAQLRPLIKEFYIKGSDPIFTIAKDNKEGYISLPKLFVQFVVDDPTEMTFAEEVFGDIAYWLKVREMGILSSHLREWRNQADILRKRKAFKAVIKEIDEGGRSAFTAARFLIDEPWKHKGLKKDSKQTTAEAFTAPDIQEDFDRIMQ